MKDFENWIIKKVELDELHQPPFFKEREIWWCSVGVNVGFEIYGKGNIFTRPVLVIRKFSNFTFLGVPLTSKNKTQKFNMEFSYKGKDGTMLFDQIRTFDSRRLASKMGRISESQFENMREKLKELF